MGTVIYYLPKKNTVNVDIILKSGLGYIIPDDRGGPSQATTTRGPDGGGGAYFGYSSKNISIGGVIENITFKQKPGTEIWFGYDSQPLPEDLERANFLRGHWTELSDGNKWHVPVIRLLNNIHTTRLPKKVIYNALEDKWEEKDVREEYQAIFEKACDIWNHYITQETTDGVWTIKNGWDIAADALMLNYRISKYEISEFGLFDSETASAAARAVIDYPTWEEYVKKNPQVIQSALTDMSSGETK